MEYWAKCVRTETQSSIPPILHYSITPSLQYSTARLSRTRTRTRTRTIHPVPFAVSLAGWAAGLGIAFAVLASTCPAQPTNNLSATNQLRVPDWVALEPNLHYDRYDQTVLDVLRPKAGSKTQRPGAIMFHGGGWVRSTKETMMANFCLPYLKEGFVVCNVEYRLAPVATAPAAVNDALKAARWFFDHAGQYNVDTNRIIVTGASAGGHLALMVGMTPESAQLGPAVKVAAIVNGYGITDVADVLEGPHRQSWAPQWLPEQEGRAALAKRLSPLTYVRRGLPPVLTVQGANDRTVPTEQGARLTRALRDAGVDAEMITVPNAGHGFSREQWPGVREQIFAFLKQRGILPAELAQ